MHNRFPVRPRPQPKESVIGYILRLAHNNGLFPLSAIFTVIEHQFSLKCFDVTSHKFKAFIERLAITLCLTEQQLHEAFKDSQAYDYHPLTSVHKIITDNPKICGHCLKSEDAYLHQNWQLMHHTHCETHLTPLISQCPCCQARLSWNAELFEGCSGCGLRWSEYSELPKRELPHYQKIAQQLSGNDLAKYLNALYAAAICVHTPFNLLAEQHKTCPFSVAEANTIFEKSYWLLTSAESNKYAETLMRELAKPLDIFNENTLKVLVHPISKLPRLMFLDSGSAPNLTVEINWQLPQTGIISDGQASVLLGISRAEINELARANVVAHTKPKQTSFYQLKHVDQFMSDLRRHSIPLMDTPRPEFLRLSNVSKISHKYLFNFGDAIKLILETGITLCSARNVKSLKDIYIEKMSLLNLLEKHEASQFSRLFSTAELTTYFCVQQVKVRLIAKIFHWKKIQVSRGCVQYHPTDIVAFVEGYVLLDKWCDQHFYPKSSLYKYLLDHNVEPLANPYEDQSKLHIFKKSDALFSTITQFERDWYKSKAPRQLKERMNIIRPLILSDSTNRFFASRCCST